MRLGKGLSDQERRQGIGRWALGQHGEKRGDRKMQRCNNVSDEERRRASTVGTIWRHKRGRGRGKYEGAQGCSSLLIELKGCIEMWEVRKKTFERAIESCGEAVFPRHTLRERG